MEKIRRAVYRVLCMDLDHDAEVMDYCLTETTQEGDLPKALAAVRAFERKHGFSHLTPALAAAYEQGATHYMATIAPSGETSFRAFQFLSVNEHE